MLSLKHMSCFHQLVKQLREIRFKFRNRTGHFGSQFGSDFSSLTSKFSSRQPLPRPRKQHSRARTFGAAQTAVGLGPPTKKACQPKPTTKTAGWACRRAYFERRQQSSLRKTQTTWRPEDSACWAADPSTCHWRGNRSGQHTLVWIPGSVIKGVSKPQVEVGGGTHGRWGGLLECLPPPQGQKVNVTGIPTPESKWKLIAWQKTLPRIFPQPTYGEGG